MRQLLYSGIMLVVISTGLGCERNAPQSAAAGLVSEGDSLKNTPVSERHFREAEKLLLEHRNEAAAKHLHEGILAFRVETGKARGNEAARVNRTIWMLTRLRSRLQIGEYVAVEEMQGVILEAEQAHPQVHYEYRKHESLPKPLMQPVSR